MPPPASGACDARFAQVEARPSGARALHPFLLRYSSSSAIHTYYTILGHYGLTQLPPCFRCVQCAICSNQSSIKWSTSSLRCTTATSSRSSTRATASRAARQRSANSHQRSATCPAFLTFAAGWRARRPAMSPVSKIKFKNCPDVLCVLPKPVSLLLLTSLYKNLPLLDVLRRNPQSELEKSKNTRNRRPAPPFVYRTYDYIITC